MTVAKAAHEKGNPFEYDGYDWKKLFVDDWLDLLIVHPEFSEKCTAIFGDSLMNLTSGSFFASSRSLRINAI